MRWNHIVPILALVLVTALAPLAVAQAVQDPTAPVLTEVQPNPVGQDFGNEWIELTNPTPVPLSLDPFYVTDGDDCRGIYPGYRYNLTGTIAPGAAMVVALPGFCLSLANTGDNLTLELEDRTPVQSLAYGPDAPLPTPEPSKTLAACGTPAGLHAVWTTAEATPGATNPSCLS